MPTWPSRSTSLSCSQRCGSSSIHQRDRWRVVMDGVDDSTEAWLEDLRSRLERGELHDIGPVDLGDGFELTGGEVAVREMFSALDRYGQLPHEWHEDPGTVARIRLLRRDLDRVRARLDDGRQSAEGT